MTMIDPISTHINEDHPWFSPVDDAADDIARYWIDNMNEDNDSVFEKIEDRAIEVGVAACDLQGQDWEQHEAFEFACVKRAKIKLLRLLAEELEEMG